MSTTPTPYGAGFLHSSDLYRCGRSKIPHLRNKKDIPPRTRGAISSEAMKIIKICNKKDIGDMGRIIVYFLPRSQTVYLSYTVKISLFEKNRYIQKK